MQEEALRWCYHAELITKNNDLWKYTNISVRISSNHYFNRYFTCLSVTEM